MPSSHHYQLNEIVGLIRMTDPGKLLDIGTGFGKFGFLAREYLELWDGREKYVDWERQIDGIEAFEPYLTPVHDYIYSTVYKGDALQILGSLTEHYDLVLMIDILEHFSREDGKKVLDHCRRISRNILVSVPISMAKQQEMFGNPYETHRYQWTRRDLRDYPDKFFVPGNRSLICYIGEDSKRIGKLFRKEMSHRNLVLLLDYLKLRTPLKKLLGRS